jgi:parvulin-like peptidyl-prolyl isomerase
MLHFMRKHAKYFYVFFFLIIISFIFFYVGPVDKSGPKPLAEIGRERISVTEFWRAYDNTRESYRDIYKEKFDAEMEQKLNLKEMVLRQLVSAKILLVAARDMGLTVTDDELREAILSEPAFQREGQFRQDVYQRTLQINRITTAYYEEKLREDLLVRKITQLIEDSVEESDEDVPQVQGNEDFARQIREAMLREKKSKAVDAFIQGLKERYKVIIRDELIA